MAIDATQPRYCDWCDVATKDLSLYRVTSTDGSERMWWLSPCCAKDVREDYRLEKSTSDAPYTPGQYRQARGVAPPREDAPSVTETIRKLRGDCGDEPLADFDPDDYPVR